MELSKDTNLLQNEIRKFSQQVIAEKVDEYEKAGKFPLEIIKKLADLGILGALIPENFGGAALDTIGLVVTLEEISKVCASTALAIAAHNVFFAYPILEFGDDTMKKAYLPKLASGEMIGGYANFPTNELMIKTTDGTDYLDGKNPIVLNAEANGPFILYLASSDKSLNAYLIDTQAQQLIRIKKNNTIGMKTAGINEIVFEGYPLTGKMIGQVGEGMAVYEKVLDLGYICFAAIGLGLCSGAFDAALKYAKERIQFGTSIINFGMIREKIAEMTTKIEAARLLVYDAALKRDTSSDYRRSAAIAKYFATQAAVEITNQAIQIYGGYGYMKDYPIERYFRDSQVIKTILGSPMQEQEAIARLTILSH